MTTISQIATTASAVALADLIEVEQGGVSKKASIQTLLRAGKTKPILTDFTATALTATISQTDTGILINAPAGITSGDLFPRVTKAPPASTFTMEAHYNAYRYYGNYTSILIFAQDTADKMMTLEALYANGERSEVNIWTDPSTYSSTPIALAMDRFPEWMKMTVDASNFTFYVSPDGVNWKSLGTSARSGLGTINRIGMAVKPNGSGSSNHAYANFDHFLVS